MRGAPLQTREAMTAAHDSLEDADRRLTAEEWLSLPRYQRYTVIDPDGWDRSDLEMSWREPITEEEFNRRLMASSVKIKPQ